MFKKTHATQEVEVGRAQTENNDVTEHISMSATHGPQRKHGTNKTNNGLFHNFFFTRAHIRCSFLGILSVYIPCSESDETLPIDDSYGTQAVHKPSLPVHLLGNRKRGTLEILDSIRQSCFQFEEWDVK